MPKETRVMLDKQSHISYMGGVVMKKPNKPVFVGVKFKETGIMYTSKEIPNEFVETVRNAVITVLFNRSLRAG